MAGKVAGDKWAMKQREDLSEWRFSRAARDVKIWRQRLENTQHSLLIKEKHPHSRFI
jgi:hypothetical protein